MTFHILLTPTCFECPFAIGESDYLVAGKGKVFCFPKEEILEEIKLLNFCQTAYNFEQYVNFGGMN